MLRTGAQKVFYLRSNDEGIRSGFDEFLKIVPETAALCVNVSQTVVNLWHRFQRQTT